MKKYNYSIIIPHKNSPELLSRCLNSIPLRDDLQIIVVDDNSCAENRPSTNRLDVNIIFLDSIQSKGAGRARNVGLEHAMGKWLLFADADDYYNDGFLNVLDNYMDANYDVIYFNYDYKDGLTGKKLPPLKWSKIYTDYNNSKESQDRMRFCNKVPWTKMVRKDYITKFNIKFEEVPNGNDIFFSLMIGCYTDNFAVEKTPIYVYLRNENSILTKKLTTEDALCKIKHRIKLNSFYDFINHSSWKLSVTKLVLHFIKDLGISFAFIVLSKLHLLYTHRNDWVSTIVSTTH